MSRCGSRGGGRLHRRAPGVKLSVRKRVNELKLQARTEINTVRAVAKGATIIPRSQTPASAPKDSQSCRPGGLEQTVTPLRRFTN